MNLLAHDIPTSISKASWLLVGKLLVSEVACKGRLDCSSSVTREDADFFQNLEMHLRSTEAASLTGRDHLAHRSYYAPVKGAIGRDPCERLRLLPSQQKQETAAELDCSVRKVERKILVSCISCMPPYFALLHS